MREAAAIATHVGRPLPMVAAQYRLVASPTRAPKERD
jgi:hypothetical protein